MSETPDGMMHCPTCGRNFVEPVIVCDHCHFDADGTPWEPIGYGAFDGPEIYDGVSRKIPGVDREEVLHVELEYADFERSEVIELRDKLTAWIGDDPL